MSMIRTPAGIKGLGWIPGNRRHFRALPVYKSSSLMHTLTPSVDLRPFDTPIKDQGDLGSCTSFMATGVMQFIRKGLSLPDMSLSELFVYYNERVLEGTVEYDSGASIGDAFTVLANPGACAETDWPYDINVFTKKPPAQCYTDAAMDIATQELALDGSLDSIKQCLAEGFPVGFGFDVYSSFENIGADGIMPVPSLVEPKLGGHAVMYVGYDDTMVANGITGYFIVRNSWGPGWGAKGYFYMPYEIATSSQASDFRTVKMVSSTPTPVPVPTPTPSPTPTPTPVPTPTPTPPPGPDPLEPRVAALESAIAAVKPVVVSLTAGAPMNIDGMITLLVDSKK